MEQSPAQSTWTGHSTPICTRCTIVFMVTTTLSCRARRNLGFSGVKLGFWDFGPVLKEVLGTAESLLCLLRNSPGNPPP